MAQLVRAVPEDTRSCYHEPVGERVRDRGRPDPAKEGRMPKLERWIVASRMVNVLNKETINTILDIGGHIGGGWCEIHQ